MTCQWPMGVALVSAKGALPSGDFGFNDLSVADGCGTEYMTLVWFNATVSMTCQWPMGVALRLEERPENQEWFQ